MCVAVDELVTVLPVPSPQLIVYWLTLPCGAIVNKIVCPAPPAVTLLEKLTLRTKVFVNKFCATEFKISIASVTLVVVVNPQYAALLSARLPSNGVPKGITLPTVDAVIFAVKFAVKLST